MVGAMRLGGPSGHRLRERLARRGEVWERGAAGGQVGAVLQDDVQVVGGDGMDGAVGHAALRYRAKARRRLVETGRALRTRGEQRQALECRAAIEAELDPQIAVRVRR